MGKRAVPAFIVGDGRGLCSVEEFEYQVRTGIICESEVCEKGFDRMNADAISKADEATKSMNTSMYHCFYQVDSGSLQGKWKESKLRARSSRWSSLTSTTPG